MHNVRPTTIESAPTNLRAVQMVRTSESNSAREYEMSGRRILITALAMLLLSGTYFADAPKDVLARLVKYTKTSVVECPDNAEDEDDEEAKTSVEYHRVCGVSKLPPEKLSKKALSYFDSLGMTLRTSWNEGDQEIGGGCIFDGGTSTLFVRIARTGSLAPEGETPYNVSFAVLKSK